LCTNWIFNVITMKYTGKWWDNPKRSEKEREAASYVATAFVWLLMAISTIILLANTVQI
jgi:hypothetical protein